MKKFECGDMKTNCYIVQLESDCFIVDPGENAVSVINYINERKLNVKAILLTHGHFDHIGTIGMFNAPIIMHEDEKFLFSTDDYNGFKWFNKKSPFDINKLNIKYIDETFTINLLGEQIKVIHTPGHTPGSVCYLYKNTLFSGDTLFKQNIGRYDFPCGKLEDLKSSILKLICNLNEKIEVYPGHGEKTTIGFEKNNNEFYLNIVGK